MSGRAVSRLEVEIAILRALALLVERSDPTYLELEGDESRRAKTMARASELHSLADLLQEEKERSAP